MSTVQSLVNPLHKRKLQSAPGCYYPDRVLSVISKSRTFYKELDIQITM